jgi:hypothetical protein
LRGDREKTLGSLIDVFGAKSFAVLFVLLLAVPALPLPTGGVTHVFELIAILVALQLVVNRKEIWLPERWRKTHIGGDRQQRFIRALMRIVRRLERISRPRLRFLFGHRISNVGFGLAVIIGSLAAFVAPPFSGLDTLPALGVVVMSIGFLLEDALIVFAGIAIVAAGIALEIVLGRAAFDVAQKLF